MAGLGASGDDPTIVHAIIRMAAGLRLDVVAEGVETAGRASILVDMGCPHGQGFLWSRAVTAGEVTEQLRLGSPTSREGLAR